MLQGAVAGLALGGVYAVIAVTMTLMAQLVRVINFAQAAVGMFAAFLAAWLAADGMPVLLALLLGLAVGALISLLIGWILGRWLAEANVSERSAVTVAALLLLISLSFIVFGTKPMTFPPLVSGTAFEVAGVVVSQVTVLVLVLALLVALGAWLMLAKTSVGVKLRAIADRPIAAELAGIPVRGLTFGVWVFSGLIVTVLVMVIAPTQTADAVSLSMLVIQASAAALLGAFRRLDLALIGGLLLGMLQGALAQFESMTVLRDWVPLVFIVLFLLWNQRKEVWDEAR